jgi:YidC/Oxa1 family membrane protein insertase
MDRTAWIAITLCLIGLVVWEVYVVSQSRPKNQPAAASPAPALTPSPAIVTESASPGASPLAPPAPAAPTSTVPAFAEVKETLRNSDVELHVTNRGGGIAEAVLLHHKAENGQKVSLNSKDHTPIGALIDNPAAPALPEYRITRQGDIVQCEYAAPEQITVRKKYFFQPPKEKQDNYLAELDVEVQNTGANGYSNPGYFLALGSAVPIHRTDYPSYTRLVWSVDSKAKGIDVTWFGSSGGFLGIGQHPAQPYYQENVKGAEWAAVSNQFYATIVAPLTGKADGVWGRRFDISPEQKLYGIEGAMRMPGLTIPPGQTYTARFQIYAGPKLYHLLARLEHNEAEIMNFGIFKLVSQFLLNFMNWLHSFLKDYGLAILALTTVIRIVLWPVQGKANRSMRQTAALAPKIQELREKYKDDPTKMNQEVMKLYKQYGINPVGGCLPMVIQIPIFFGLYQMLGQAVELRNQSFLWVPDLSQPDTVAHLPVLGWPINILPLCMAATQVWLMAMTPKTGDPTQRRVMMFTPLIFLFICYNFAAALALYYTAQNLFSILQFYQNRNQPMPTLEKVASAGKGGRKK